MIFRDFTQRRFGRLVALAVAGKDRKGNAVWECQCDCGRTHRVVGSVLNLGKSRSCGCLRREVSGARLRSFHSSRQEVAHA